MFCVNSTGVGHYPTDSSCGVDTNLRDADSVTDARSAARQPECKREAKREDRGRGRSGSTRWPLPIEESTTERADLPRRVRCALSQRQSAGHVLSPLRSEQHRRRASRVFSEPFLYTTRSSPVSSLKRSILSRLRVEMLVSTSSATTWRAKPAPRGVVWEMGDLRSTRTTVVHARPSDTPRCIPVSPLRRRQRRLPQT